MFIFSIAHCLAFPVKPYELEETLNVWPNIANAANVSDFHSDVKEQFVHFKNKCKERFFKNRIVTEPTVAEEEGSEEDDLLINIQNGNLKEFFNFILLKI
jgi:hypothetical protein